MTVSVGYWLKYRLSIPQSKRLYKSTGFCTVFWGGIHVHTGWTVFATARARYFGNTGHGRVPSSISKGLSKVWSNQHVTNKLMGQWNNWGENRKRPLGPDNWLADAQVLGYNMLLPIVNGVWTKQKTSRLQSSSIWCFVTMVCVHHATVFVIGRYSSEPRYFGNT